MPDHRPTGSSRKVAVLLSVHRGADAAQLDEALASMRAQTHSPLYLYVYADGPLDAAHEYVLTRHLDERGGDLLVHGESARGLPTGLNTLIDAALQDRTIEFLARMDADDLSEPARITRQLEFFDQNPQVSVAGTWCIEFETRGEPLFSKQLPTEPDAVERAMLLRNALAHPTVMFRRAVFERGFRYDPDFLVMQDYELWSRLLLAGVVISNVPEYLLWFRVNRGFYGRRHGWQRAWSEVRLRLRHARRRGRLRPGLLLALGGLFAVRVMPAPIKRLAYRHLR